MKLSCNASSSPVIFLRLQWSVDHVNCILKGDRPSLMLISMADVINMILMLQ